MSTLKISEAGLALIRGFERCRLVAYKPTPADRWTVGWGATYYPDGRAVRRGDRITQVEADALLAHHVAEFAGHVARLVTSTVNQAQFDALVSLAYNIGARAFEGSTLLRVVNRDPNAESIRARLMAWNKQDGRVLNGLVARRAAEADLYFS